MKSLLFAALMLAFLSCDKQKSTTVTMTYHMTQCADAWMNDAYFLDKEGTLKAFLANEGVEVISLSIQTDCGTAAVCAACNCLGCDIATVEVPQSDEDKMKTLHFVPK
jgi:hypothetical protein